MDRVECLVSPEKLHGCQIPCLYESPAGGTSNRRCPVSQTDLGTERGAAPGQLDIVPPYPCFFVFCLFFSSLSLFDFVTLKM